MATTVDVQELEAKVKHMYRQVAEEPGGAYHFEMGRSLASASAIQATSSIGFPRLRSSRLRASATSSISPPWRRASG